MDYLSDFYENSHNFIKKMCLETGILKDSSISTAMVYFHKYFTAKQNISFLTEDIYLICTSCVFLSSKTTNRFLLLDELIHFLLNLEPNLNEVYKDFYMIREKLITIEFDILITIGFDLAVELPHKYLLEMKPYFETHFKYYAKKMIEQCCYFINDSFSSPICINFHPLVIALSSVNLLELHLKINLKNTFKNWFFSSKYKSSVQFEEIENLSLKMLKMYIKNKMKRNN